MDSFTALAPVRSWNTNPSPLDENTQEIYYVEMSHAFKLLLDEIKSIGIFPRLLLKDKA